MKQELYDQLIKNIDELKADLGKYSTSLIINTFAWMLREHAMPGTETRKPELMSPAKHCFYLFGLMLSSPEPFEPERLEKKAIDAIVDKLNEIATIYAFNYWPSADEKDNKAEEWYRVREVAIPRGYAGRWPNSPVGAHTRGGRKIPQGDPSS